MPFRFALVCDLLQQIDESQQLRGGNKSDPDAIRLWFKCQRGLIDGDTDAVALLSTLLPEKRTDRVYGVQAGGLERLIARALCLGRSRMQELARYQQPGLGLDLGDCVEFILTATVSLCLPSTANRGSCLGSLFAKANLLEAIID